MTATYNADDTLADQSQLSKPTSYPEQFPIGSPQCEFYKKQHRDYHAHLASLRTLVCSPECRGLWAAGQKLEEGKDYKLVKECMTYYESCEMGSTCDRCLLVAFPLPVKSEDPDDIWFELLKHVGMDEEFILNWITELKFKYSLTKK